MACRPPARRCGPSGGSWGAGVREARAGRRIGSRGAGEIHSRSRRCTSRTISPPIRLLLERLPMLPQIACFDTAFHRDQPPVAQAFALPQAMTERGVHPLRLPRPVVRIRRAGAAGARLARSAAGKVVVLHLGNGVQHVRDRGRPQRREHDGIHRRRWAADGHALRQSRSGRGAVPAGRAQDGRACDREADLPAVGPARRVRHLQRHAHARSERRAASEGRDRRSTSTGSGASWARWRRRSAAWMRSCSRQVSARTADRLRERVCRDAAWLGVELDVEANAAARRRTDQHRRQVAFPSGCIPTNEELMIARHTRNGIDAGRGRLLHDRTRTDLTIPI